MPYNDDQILIKNKDGQLKTVGLAVAVPHDTNATNSDNSKQSAPDTKRAVVSNSPQQPVNSQPSTVASINQSNKVKTPAFYFDVADEEEVAQFKNGNHEQLQQQKIKLFKLMSEKIIKETAISLSPEHLLRLEKLIISALRQVRNLIELKEVLAKDLSKGGLSLEVNVIQKIVDLVEEEKKVLAKIKDEQLSAEIEKLEKIVTAPKDNYQQPIKESVQNYSSASIERTLKDILTSNQEIHHSVPAIKPNVQKTSQDVVLPQDKPKSDIQPTKSFFAEEKQKTTNAFSFSKSIKADKRTTSPIDELSQIDLTEFRTYGTDAKARVNKIYEKIKMLEEESIAKKVEGIKAWKTSPVYQQYLKIGNQSLATDTPIESLLTTKQTLSLDEFEAIVDLNEQLNY